jgi:putative transposase
VIIDFIREHAGRAEPGGLRWGVEPICRVLTEHGVEIAPSTYYLSGLRDEIRTA